jgi:DNA-binding response OmpR family regulator
MSVQREPTVLIVADHEDTRALYVETLTAAGCVVLAPESYDEVVPLASETRIDVVVLDIGLHASAFAIAERLAPLQNRPRLIAVTDLAPNGTSVERLFDAFIVKPCLPDDLVEAVHEVMWAPVPDQDLLIIARESVGVPEVVQRFGDIGARVEIRVDQRHGEGWRPANSSAGDGRRRRDRRARDVSERLRTAGWVFVPGAQRS